MWIIANGAPKNGSTWIKSLLSATKRLHAPATDLRDPRWSNASVSVDQVGNAVVRLAPGEKAYLTKQHWSARIGESTPAIAEILSHPGVKMLNILRDVRDMVVSRYHQDVRVAGFTGTLSDYVVQRARQTIREQTDYQRFWIERPHAHAQNYWITTYEHLSADYEAEANALFDFTGLPIDETHRQAAIEANRFAARQAKSKQFYRKGVVFGYRDDLTASEADSLLEMASSSGLLDVKRAIAKFRPALCDSLRQTDLGL